MIDELEFIEGRSMEEDCWRMEGISDWCWRGDGMGGRGDEDNRMVE